MSTAAWNSEGVAVALHTDGEGTHVDFPVYIVLHPSQLPSHVASREETVHEGVLLLAVCDELEGTIDGLLETRQSSGHRRVHRPHHLERRQAGDEYGHLLLESSALLLVLLDRPHGFIELECNFDDPQHNAQCDVGHF